MNNLRRLLPAVVFLMAACATTPRPPLPAPTLPHVPLSSPAGEGAAEQRVRADLERDPSIPIPDHPTIRGALNLFTTDMRDDIQTSLTRSGRYRKMIDRALAEYRLPGGLAYLPVIESAYVPSVTSRAGAHGIWQFMPATAREYGLRIDWWVDERADPEKSARAAAAYLNDLYRDFNDWPLTLAAYNAGPGRIHRAMESTGATTFWSLLELGAIPKETRGYVPTFYATLLIASDPATYGFRLGDAAEHDEKQVAIDGPLSLAYVAVVAGIDRDIVRAMNPALRRAIVPPGGTTIHLPSKAADVIAPRAATLKNDDPNLAVCTFRLRDGDTVSRLARAIGTSTDTLMAMNALDSVNAVGEGDSILLPIRARELATVLAHSHDAAVFYNVRKGDTCYSIAKRHGLSVEELRDLNDLSAHAKLHPGQRLRVSPARGVTAGN